MRKIISLFGLAIVLHTPHTNAETITIQKTAPQTVRGVISAREEALISSSLSARITNIPFKIGDRFNKGDLLVEFDCMRTKSELTALKASYKALSIAYSNEEELFKHGAAGSLDMKMAEADMEKAKAEAKAKEVQLSDCKIFAPYEGSIAERHVDRFETPAAGAPLLRIINGAALEIKLIAPSKWLRWIEKESSFHFTIDETEASYAAKVIRIGASVDSVSQTVDLVAQFTEETPLALTGMSGVAAFKHE